MKLSLFIFALRIDKITSKKAEKIAFLSLLKKETAQRVKFSKRFQ